MNFLIFPLTKSKIQVGWNFSSILSKFRRKSIPRSKREKGEATIFSHRCSYSFRTFLTQVKFENPSFVWPVLICCDRVRNAALFAGICETRVSNAFLLAIESQKYPWQRFHTSPCTRENCSNTRRENFSRAKYIDKWTQLERCSADVKLWKRQWEFIIFLAFSWTVERVPRGARYIFLSKSSSSPPAWILISVALEKGPS